MIQIAPSLLSADFCHLAEDINSVQAAGADWLHLDVMDGLFVPNISFGVPVIKSIRSTTDMIFDVHLMIDQPHRYIETFCEVGADYLTFHVEADSEEKLRESIAKVHALGKKAGLVIKPKTSWEAVLPFVGDLDLILVMTVEPGFGGQAFMADMLPKLQALDALRKEKGYHYLLEADGGVSPKTAPQVIQAGCDVLVAGSAVFKAENRAEVIAEMKKE